jgi:hypothetical protein
MLDTLIPELRTGDLVFIGFLIVLSFGLLIAFMVWPVSLPQYLGAPAIAVAGAAGIALFGSMVLTYWFLANGAPAGTTLVLAIAFVFGFVNDNHYVRLADKVAPLTRAAPAQHYVDWRAQHPVRGAPGAREPVILVAASGGGIRAAYWTASVLAAMDSIPGFADNLFAISGISGGILGEATYLALKRDQLDGGQQQPVLPRVRSVLAHDFLSPVAAGMLFPDLAQRFFFVPIPWADRQRFLEASWEDALGPSPNAFTRGFTDLYAANGRDRLPSVLLNATVVETGSRAIVSNMDVTGFSDTVDLLANGYSTQKARLSAAAGMSARFTYVSPAGSLTGPDGTKMRVVDGGYFENFGAVSAMDVLTALRTGHPNLFPILVLIRNDPRAASVCERSNEIQSMQLSPIARGPRSNELVSEVVAPPGGPPQGPRGPRAARGDHGRQRVEAMGGAVVEISLAAVTQVELRAAQSSEAKETVRRRTLEPPLG